MSRIQLVVDIDPNNAAAVKALIDVLASSKESKDVAKMEVVDAEEVKAPEAEKPAPKPRPSRAKAKPQPEPEEDEDEDLDDEGLEDIDEAEEETIDADDLRAKQAEKVAAHRATIKAKLTELGATGIKDLDEKHYQKYFDFLSKLK